jgi:CBS-domain-containing membrane protein
LALGWKWRRPVVIFSIQVYICGHTNTLAMLMHIMESFLHALNIITELRQFVGLISTAVLIRGFLRGAAAPGFIALIIVCNARGCERP